MVMVVLALFLPKISRLLLTHDKTNLQSIVALQTNLKFYVHAYGDMVYQGIETEMRQISITKLKEAY